MEVVFNFFFVLREHFILVMSLIFYIKKRKTINLHKTSDKLRNMSSRKLITNHL
jgi:hypothetical protein